VELPTASLVRRQGERTGPVVAAVHDPVAADAEDAHDVDVLGVVAVRADAAAPRRVPHQLEVVEVQRLVCPEPSHTPATRSEVV
jgi:hypothetical protein